MLNRSKGNCCIPPLGVTAIYFGLIALGYGLLMYINRSNAPEQITPAYEVVQLKQIKGKNQPGLDLAALSKPTPELMNKGNELFKANCVMCHGPDGKGDGVAAAGLPYPPRNFYDAKGWTNPRTFRGIFGTITKGITARGMLAYDTMSAKDRIALTHYVLTKGPQLGAPSGSELQALDKEYKLSAGIKEPNQVPISRAVELLVAEATKRAEQIAGMVKNVETDTKSANEGAALLQATSSDLTQAVKMLVRNQVWVDSVNALQSFLVANAPNHGFNTGFKNFNRAQWNALLGYLRHRFYGKKLANIALPTIQSAKPVHMSNVPVVKASFKIDPSLLGASVQTAKKN